MRRKEKEITNINELIEIIDNCKVLRLAMCVNDVPYIVPLNFGYAYEEGHFEFYFHCAKEGKKLEYINKNSNVCIGMDCDHGLKVNDKACGYNYRYKSIIGCGKAEIVEDIEDKKKYLCSIMSHQTQQEFSFEDNQTQAVAVCKVRVSKISGKKSL